MTGGLSLSPGGLQARTEAVLIQSWNPVTRSEEVKGRSRGRAESSGAVGSRQGWVGHSQSPGVYTGAHG